MMSPPAIISNRWLKDEIIVAILILAMALTAAGLWIDEPWIGLILPGITATAYLVLMQLKLLYRLLFFLIPLSMEVQLTGGLSTDLLGEPMLWLLFVVTLVIVITRGLAVNLSSPLAILVALHLIWIMYCAMMADNQLISFKYLMAKTWYIVPFYILPFHLDIDKKELRRLLQYFIVGLLMASAYFFIQHWQDGLTYMSRTNAGQPIWRNHVNYACTMVISLPMLWYLHATSRHPDRWLYITIAIWVLIGVYFAYARIAYLCMLVAVGHVFIIKMRLTALAITSVVLISIGAILWLSHDNRYLHLAPHYEKAIMQDDFGGKISATTSGEDISTMERVHRWVAGSRMISDQPWTGVGPGNFYGSYRPYSIFSFETYVSNNPERSGIHNYYLMVLVEQGYIGFMLFISLIIFALLRIESIYHKATSLDNNKLLLMAGSILIMIITINAVNDMIEVIKIGGIFWFLLFVIGNEQDVMQLKTNDEANSIISDSKR